MNRPAHRQSDAVHASLLQSACTLEEASTPNRADPYWDRLWAPGSQANWATGSQERTLAAIENRQVNQRFLMPRAEALRHATSNHGRSARLSAWGAADAWRTLSAEQLAALAGNRSLLDPRNAGTAASFSLDIMDIGSFPHPVHREPGVGRGLLYRPTNSTSFENLITPTLTYPEWVSVTGGSRWSSGGQYDRHNLLATELALRAAEYLPVGAVLGEKHASVSALVGKTPEELGKRLSTKRADGIIVRKDGLRIALELTATASASFDKKVELWADLLNRHPLETSGLVVLFVAAPHPDRTGGRDPRKETFNRLAQAIKKHPGTGGDAAAARIGVISWDEWFPARHEISEDFFSMTAHFASGDGTGIDQWERRDLLGDYAFTPWHTFDATAIIDNARLLTASPHWLRSGEHTRLLGTPMSRAGVEIPVPPLVRPGTGLPLPLGAGRGVSGAVGLPPRLRVRG